MINFKWWLVPWAVGFGPRPGAWPRRVNRPFQLRPQPPTIQPQSSLPTWAWRVWWAPRASNPCPWSFSPPGKWTGPRPTAFRGRPHSCDFYRKNMFLVAISCQIIVLTFLCRLSDLKYAHFVGVNPIFGCGFSFSLSWGFNYWNAMHIFWKWLLENASP